MKNMILIRVRYDPNISDVSRNPKSNFRFLLSPIISVLFDYNILWKIILQVTNIQF